MEQLNSANECDTRSVVSKRSDGSSGSNNSTNQINSVRQSASQHEDDENVDLWTVKLNRFLLLNAYIL
jgi:hypothetical protein